MKTCTKCQETKPLDGFDKNKSKKDGFKSHCKLCIKAYQQANKEKISARDKAYYEANKEKISAQKKAYQQANKEKISARKKAYRQTNKEKRSAYKKANRERINAWKRQRLKHDVQFRLSSNLRSGLARAIKNAQKAGSAVRDLGCTIPELKQHLESQFTEGMTWDNWAQDGWHIDHIKPLASFDLTDRKQFLEACHYTNLQPLWAEENWIKGARIQHEPKHHDHRNPGHFTQERIIE